MQDSIGGDQGYKVYNERSMGYLGFRHVRQKYPDHPDVAGQAAGTVQRLEGLGSSEHLCRSFECVRGVKLEYVDGGESQSGRERVRKCESASVVDRACTDTSTGMVLQYTGSQIEAFAASGQIGIVAGNGP